MYNYHLLFVTVLTIWVYLLSQLWLEAWLNNSNLLVYLRLSRSGGWVRNAENKAQLRPAGAGALPELGKNWGERRK